MSKRLPHAGGAIPDLRGSLTHPFMETTMSGQFFAVEAQAWPRVCTLGLNAAVAYLVLAQGSQQDNRSTNWSVHAVESYTGISRSRAKRALELLEDNGLIEMTRPKPRPWYDLLPGYPDASNLSEAQRAFLQALAAGRPAPMPAAADLEALTTQGLIRISETGAITAAPGAVPDWIWLPNALVIGANDETTPVDRLRQSRDLEALRLLVDLYGVHNLADYGGLPPTLLSGCYTRAEVGTQGPYVVWGFSRQGASLGNHPFIDRRLAAAGCDDEALASLREQFTRLYSLGLIECTPLLFEGCDADAEPLHPLDPDADDAVVRDVAETAGSAAMAMLTEPQQARALLHEMTVVPVERHIADVQLVDVYRLRYRPHTGLTAAWWADTRQRSQDALARYTGLRERALDIADPRKRATSM
jgi:hypothetical protein